MLETAYLKLDTTLGRGSRDGERVARVQEWLRFHDVKTTIDGRYGPATEECVKTFQDKENLPVTGEVDPDTWAALVKPMLDALQAPSPTGTNLSAATLACARLHLDNHAGEVGGNNRGPWVRLYLRGQQRPLGGAVRQASWCAGFVSTMMEQAAATLHRGAIFAYHTDCNKLAAEAKKRRLFVKGKAAVPPGSLMLMRRPTGGWHHTGVVVAAGSQTVVTIEGNAPHVSGGRSDSVALETHSYGKLDFVLLR